jgi:hypothetical protein
MPARQAARPAPVKPALTRPGRRTTAEDLGRVPTAVLHRALLERRRASASRDVRAPARSQTGTYYETDKILAMVARMIRAAGRRVGGGDIELAGELDRMLRDAREEALGTAWWALLRRGYSSVEVAAQLGVSKQAAFQRFAPFRPADMPPRWDRPRRADGSGEGGGASPGLPAAGGVSSAPT